jgi:hypothetical protein
MRRSLTVGKRFSRFFELAFGFVRVELGTQPGSPGYFMSMGLTHIRAKKGEGNGTLDLSQGRNAHEDRTSQTHLPFLSHRLPDGRSQRQLTAGTFNGLFLQADAVQNDRSGYVSVKLTPQGSFSGSLLLAGKRIPFAGKFNSLPSSVSLTLPRAGASPLSLTLDLSDVDSIQGSVSDGNWTVPLSADRLVWNKSTAPATEQVGQYTTSIDKVNSPDQPNGYGYGTVSVDSGGAVKFLGALGDGTKVTQKSAVSPSGRWPFYLAAYGGKGSVIGWIPLSNTNKNISPWVWTKEAGAAGPLYPSGFNIATRLFSSPYQAPAPGHRVIEVSNGYAVLEDGSLDTPIVNELVLSAQNKVQNMGDHKLTLTFVTKTGLFNGTVVEPGTGIKIKFAGIVFQADDLAVGNFVVHSESGSVVVAGDLP